MSIEDYDPRETDELARARTLLSMVSLYGTFDRANLEGMFNRLNETEGEHDEV